MTSPVTQYDTFSTTRRGKRIVGKMSTSYSQLMSNVFSGYHIDTCFGTAKFSLVRR